MSNLINGNAGIFSHPMLPSLPGNFSNPVKESVSNENVPVKGDGFEFGHSEIPQTIQQSVVKRSFLESTALKGAESVKAATISGMSMHYSSGINSIESIARDGILTLSGEKIA